MPLAATGCGGRGKGEGRLCSTFTKKKADTNSKKTTAATDRARVADPNPTRTLVWGTQRGGGMPRTPWACRAATLGGFFAVRGSGRAWTPT
mmetsp:Transcript_11934/g.25937  ORF Transcript_11934/g.25937 Transcript_11934/m.25937 type:complete len:91 (-) Transcript_11934:1389-1661(-)